MTVWFFKKTGMKAQTGVLNINQEWKSVQEAQAISSKKINYFIPFILKAAQSTLNIRLLEVI